MGYHHRLHMVCVVAMLVPSAPDAAFGRRQGAIAGLQEAWGPPGALQHHRQHKRRVQVAEKRQRRPVGDASHQGAVIPAASDGATQADIVKEVQERVRRLSCTGRRYRGRKGRDRALVCRKERRALMQELQFQKQLLKRGRRDTAPRKGWRAEWRVQL